MDHAIQGAISGRKILVTGGTGFIGGRLVEKLVVECNAAVRVVVRNFARALRVARLPVEIVYGDITEPETVNRAAEGCDIVIHCAYGDSGTDAQRRLANVEGTKNVVRACMASGVKRLVHLSTVQVYGPLGDGSLDEAAPRRFFGDSYSDSKLETEQMVQDYINKDSLPAVIVQPTIVYGPYSTVWTTALLTALKKFRHILVNDGEGLCNAVYIDDLVDAIALAVIREQALGECFLISGEEPVTWRDFYQSYERMLGGTATVSMSLAESNAYCIKNRKSNPSLFNEALRILRDEPLVRQRIVNTAEVALLRKAANSFLPAKFWQSIEKKVKGDSGDGKPKSEQTDRRPIRLLRFPLDAKFYAAKTTIRIDKAKKLLGYRPSFDLERGMDLTGQWARWANLLGAALCWQG